VQGAEYSKGSDVEGGRKRGGDGDIICPKVFRGKFRLGVVIRLGGPMFLRRIGRLGL